MNFTFSAPLESVWFVRVEYFNFYFVFIIYCNLFLGVVEGMAAGTVMLAHESGGPKMDIVVEYENKPTGFLAHDVNSYSRAIKEIFDMSPLQRLELRKNARNSLFRFSEMEFEVAFLTLCEPLFSSTGIVA